MVEVQAHGFTFEKWVCDTFFEGYSGDYMRKWDIPAETNTSKLLPRECRGLPISIKTSKYGSPVNLGDILRQRQINTTFLMIVGFWHQHTPKEKWIEEIGVAFFSPAKWSALWGDLRLEQLLAIDAVVKNLDLGHTVARQEARRWKKITPSVSTSTFVVNPKIDSKSQRRIQCSLPFAAFWQAAGREPARADSPMLFDHPFPNPIKSTARQFRG